MVNLVVLGVSSGTSVDGIDLAVVEIAGESLLEIYVRDYAEVSWQPSVRAEVLRLCRPGIETTLAEICALNFVLGDIFADAVEGMVQRHPDIDLIASHGQTLWHAPSNERKSTLQMGEPAVIAQRSGRTVVSNFRTAEVAIGRQGAPICGFFEASLLAHQNFGRVSQNIGGMGNCCYVPPMSSGKHYFQFDTGPGNVLIDATMRILTNGEKSYDKDGEVGAEGCVDEEFLEKFLSQPFFSAPLPKTTGREMFGDDIASICVAELRKAGRGVSDIIATITRITSESIARAYEQYVLPFGPLDELYICGGGAYNPNILSHLGHRFPGARVCILDDGLFGVRASAKEAVMFAVLGFCAVHGRSVQVPGLVESSEETIMGVITPGKNYKALMKKIVEKSEFIGGKTVEDIRHKNDQG